MIKSDHKLLEVIAGDYKLL